MKQETVDILKFTVGEGDFETIERAAQSLKDGNMVIVQFADISEESEAQYLKILEDTITIIDGSTNRISTDTHIFAPCGIVVQCFEN